MIGGAYFSRLSGDATLVAMLGTYNGLPAIFNSDDVPHDTGRPYVLIDAPSDDAPAYGSTGLCPDHDTRRIEVSVFVIGDNSGSRVSIGAICERVRDCLHNDGARAGYTTRLASTGMDGIRTNIIAGPIPAPADEKTQAREMVFRTLQGG